MQKIKFLRINVAKNAKEYIKWYKYQKENYNKLPRRFYKNSRLLFCKKVKRHLGKEFIDNTDENQIHSLLSTFYN